MAKYQSIPAHLSEAQFDAALGRLKLALGKENVISDPGKLTHFRDPFPIGDTSKPQHLCSAVVQPSSVVEVQEVVSIANNVSIPIWPYSRGKNNGYGGPAPRVPGSILVDLGRMKKIIEVNDQACYALVEPGVTFFDLFNHCQKLNLNVYPSVPSLGWGSVVGNALDRGWGYTPLGEHCQAQCGLEAVLPTGEIIRTGMGAIKNSKTWQCFKPGYGPSLDSLFFQSNLGIVTKMGIWLYPKQEGFMSCDIQVEEEDHLAPLVDKLGHLYRTEILQNHPVIGNVIRALAAKGPRRMFYDGDGAIPDGVLDVIRKRHGFGFWNARFALYGTEAMIQCRWSAIKAAFDDMPSARLTNKAYLANNASGLLDAEQVPVTEAGGTQIGIPNMLRLQSINFRGENGGHICFSPVLPPNGAEALTFYYIGKQISAQYGFDFHAGFHLYQHHLAHLNLLYFDNDSVQSQKMVHACFIALLGAAKEKGYSEYRTHLSFMDAVADQFDFNDHIHMRVVERLKDTLDPKGILAPGKSGIWPIAYRGRLATAMAPQHLAVCNIPAERVQSRL